MEQRKKKTHSDNCWGSISIKHFLSNFLHKKSETALEAVMFLLGWLASFAASCELPRNPDKGEDTRRSAQPRLPRIHTSWQNTPCGNETSHDQNTAGWRRGYESSRGSYPLLLHPPHISPRLFLGVWAYQLSCQTLLRAKCID